MSIYSKMQSIRGGKTYKNGFLTISLASREKDTFLVETLHNGTVKRDELSNASVRRILKDS